MSAMPAVTYSTDADGVGWIIFDDPGVRANVLNLETQNALAAAITAAEQDGGTKALVVISGKERIFIAGADLNLIASLTDSSTASELSRRGQRLFQRLADF